MEDYVRDMWGGPGHLRFYLQPLMALILSMRDGLADARAGRPPYLLSLITARAARSERLARLLKRLALPLTLAFGMDLLLQFVIRGEIRPLATPVYATLFVVLPYVVGRALTNRVTRHEVHRPVEG